MSFDLILKPTCGRCGSNNDLYGSNCKHLTLCASCGKNMAENRAKCFECGTPVTRLIREYNVRTSSTNDKNYFIGRFPTGLPNFSKKKSAENKWTLQKEGLQGRQITDAAKAKEKLKNKPWMLEDETGQSQYQGHLEGAQSATYYLLMMQAKEFVAIPAGSWYNFNKVAQYKQLTLEEAEEKMKNRRKFVDGYERWMMKTASNGAAAFPSFDASLVKDIRTAGGGKGRKKQTAENDGNASDKGEDEGEEDVDRKPKLGPSKGVGDDDDDEGPAGGDFDDDDDNIEKGDDWEHEEIFTDDDEAVGNDPEEREDLMAPELPAPPEIKQDDDDDDANEEEGGLSKSGKELKKLLLGRANGLNDSDRDEDDDSSGRKKKDEDDDDDEDEEDRPSPVLAPKMKDPKVEPADSSPAKPTSGGSSRATPASKSAKGKRKNSDDTKSASAAPQKKVKTENDVKSTTKENASKNGAKVPPPSSAKAGPSTQGTSTQGPVSEEEIRAVLLQRAPVTTSDLVGTFKARLKTPEDKKAFADILKRISKIQKSDNKSYVVLRERGK